MLLNKPTILAKIEGKSGTPCYHKKKFRFGFRTGRYLNLFKTILYILVTLPVLYFGFCLHSRDFGTGAIVTKNGMIIHSVVIQYCEVQCTFWAET